MSQAASNTQSVHVVLGTVGGVLAIGAIAVVSIVSVVIVVVVHMRRKQKSIPVEKGGLIVFVCELFTGQYLTNFLHEWYTACHRSFSG